MNYLQIWVHKVPFSLENEYLAMVWNLAEFDVVKEKINYSESKVLPELLFHESLHAMIHFMGLWTPEPGKIRITNLCNMLANALMTSYVVVDGKSKKLSSHFDALFLKTIKLKELEVKIANRYFTLIHSDDIEWEIYRVDATQEGMSMKVSINCDRPQIWWMTGILENLCFAWWIYTGEQIIKFQEEQFVRVMTQAILPYVERHFIF